MVNCYTAIEQNLEVLPVLNKIGFASGRPRCGASGDRRNWLIDAAIFRAVQVSAKTGQGIVDLLEELIEVIPPPTGKREADTQALIVDSWFDNYPGVVSLVRVISGKLSKKDRIILKSLGKVHQIDSVGIFTPN